MTLWNDFITGFCKVEFLCYAGDPNWLGVGFLLTVAMTVVIFIGALSDL